MALEQGDFESPVNSADKPLWPVRDERKMSPPKFPRKGPVPNSNFEMKCI